MSNWLSSFAGLGMVILALAYFAAWAYSLWELAFKRDDLSPSARVGWALAIVLTSGFGLIAYVVFSSWRRPSDPPSSDDSSAAQYAHAADSARHEVHSSCEAEGAPRS